MKGLFSYPESKDLYGIFNDSFPPILDGVTLAVENYVYWLSRKGHTPCVVTPWNPEKQDYPFEVVRYFSLPNVSRHTNPATTVFFILTLISALLLI